MFVKGSPDQKRARALDREETVAPLVAGLSPALLWSVRAAGWRLLGWEHIDGRHVDYAPGSPDIPKVVDVLARLGEVTAPGTDLFRRWATD